MNIFLVLHQRFSWKVGLNCILSQYTQVTNNHLAKFCAVVHHRISQQVVPYSSHNSGFPLHHLTFHPVKYPEAMHRTLKSICHQERDQHKHDSAQTQGKCCNMTTVEQESEANQGFMGGKWKQTLAEVPGAGLPFRLPHSHLSLAPCSPFPPLPPSLGEPFGGSSQCCAWARFRCGAEYLPSPGSGSEAVNTFYSMTQAKNSLVWQCSTMINKAIYGLVLVTSRQILLSYG